MKIYAYARVSARDQNLTRQLEAFRQFGVVRNNIYCDKKSGKDFDRTNYLRLLRKIKCGDLLVIKSIDRLGRNYNLIIEEWTRITKHIRADILVLDMPLLDTREKNYSLVGKFISDIVLQILSFVAENERVNSKLRQSEGIAAAKKNGVRFGRPFKNLPRLFDSLAARFLRREITMSEAGKRLDMSPATFYYHVQRQYRESNADAFFRRDAFRERFIARDERNKNKR